MEAKSYENMNLKRKKSFNEKLLSRFNICECLEFDTRANKKRIKLEIVYELKILFLSQ